MSLRSAAMNLKSIAFSLFFALSQVCSALSQDAISASAVDDLTTYLEQDIVEWAEISEQHFVDAALSKAEAALATNALIQLRRKQLRKERAEEMESLQISVGEHRMPFFFKTFGSKPEGGRSLFISMHGGGGAPKRVNDRQWNNQKRLYTPKEGVYVAPRAPTDTWNLWHQQHIMLMFDRLIENMILFQDVNPNRVYILGYSAGGDGVYQLAPRMADRWAAAAMMAGHPNDARPENLRNIGFALYMGGKDGAYDRNKVAAEWGEKLAALHASDPTGYQHLVTIYPDKGHWMDGEDASALPWMSKFTRSPLPRKIVWRKDGNPQSRFYWLGADPAQWKNGQTIIAERDGQTIKFSGADEMPKGLTVYFNDDMIDLDKIVTMDWQGSNKLVRMDRSMSTIHSSLSLRFDPTSVMTSVAKWDE